MRKKQKSMKISYNIECYYDAIPYLQICREGGKSIRCHHGPLQLIFDCFASAIEAGKQANNNKLLFEQINNANSTICLVELFMFCDFFNITNRAFISRFEIQALLKITLTKFYPMENSGVLDCQSFCDFLCHVAILVYSRPPLQNVAIDTNYKKIEAFLNYTKLNDIEYVKSKLLIPRNYGFSVNDEWKNKINQLRKKKSNKKQYKKCIKLNKKRRSIGKLQIGSMNVILADDEGNIEQQQYFQFQKPSSLKSSKSTPTLFPSISGTKTKQNQRSALKINSNGLMTKQLMTLRNHDLMMTRKLLRQNRRNDWRKFKNTQLDMNNLYISSNHNNKYRYKLAILNGSKHHIRIDIKCESPVFVIRFDTNYFSQGMTKLVHIETINYNEMDGEMINEEQSTSITIYGINRKNECVWKSIIPINYKILPIYPNSHKHQLQKRYVLPKCVPPLQF